MINLDWSRLIIYEQSRIQYSYINILHPNPVSIHEHYPLSTLIQYQYMIIKPNPVSIQEHYPLPIRIQYPYMIIQPYPYMDAIQPYPVSTNYRYLT